MPLGQVNISYTADTSQVSFSGEVRTISIDTTGLIQSSITAYAIGFGSGVSVVYENGEVTVTFARNSGGTKRGYIVIAATTVQDEMVTTSVQFTQDASPAPYSIHYTADTTEIAATGETRYITIDTTSLIESSITVDIEGATGATASYSNGTVTVVFQNNDSYAKSFTVIISSLTEYEAFAAAFVSFTQNEPTVDYLQFNIVCGGTINWSKKDSVENTQYRINNGEWHTIKYWGKLQCIFWGYCEIKRKNEAKLYY